MDTTSGTLRIALLGQFQVTVGGRAIGAAAWRLRKAAALVKLLALAPGGQLVRDEILDLLWPELGPDAATNNFRYALHLARRVLEQHGVRPGSLHLAGGTLALAPGSPPRVDVAEFERAADVALRATDPARLQAALSLYTGDLLPEDRYEEWAIARREALRERHLGLLLALARAHEGRREWGPAIAALQRVAEVDPAHEEAGAALMRLYALAGQPAQARRHYHQLATSLRRELDAAPGAATTALHRAIGEGRFPAPGDATPARSGGGAVAHAPLATTSPSPRPR